MDSRFDAALNAHVSLEGGKVRAIDHRHAMWLSPERALRSALDGRFFVAGNPFRERARVELVVRMPPFLERAGCVRKVVVDIEFGDC